MTEILIFCDSPKHPSKRDSRIETFVRRPYGGWIGRYGKGVVTLDHDEVIDSETLAESIEGRRMENMRLNVRLECNLCPGPVVAHNTTLNEIFDALCVSELPLSLLSKLVSSQG